MKNIQTGTSTLLNSSLIKVILRQYSFTDTEKYSASHMHKAEKHKHLCKAALYLLPMAEYCWETVKDNVLQSHFDTPFDTENCW